MFAVFIWFCARFIWPPLMRAIENRQKQVAEGLAAAEKGRQALEISAKQAEETIADARAREGAEDVDARLQRVVPVAVAVAPLDVVAPAVFERGPGPPGAVDLEPMITRRGKYRPMRELEYGNGYPIVEGYRDSAALGWHARLADPDGAPVVIHCHAGKDRTGVIVALLLSVLGVSRNDILSDRIRQSHAHRVTPFLLDGVAVRDRATRISADATLDGGLGVGMAICFEHAFPEIFTTLALRGASLILIPSAVPRGYEYLLELRTRARAQDNQLFVAAANLVGFDGQTHWCGGSAIVDPRGALIAHAGDAGEAEIVATLDLDLLERERDQEPSLVHRRPELYT